jgi:hypothetical protein
VTAQTVLEISENASPVVAGLSHYIAALTTMERFEALTRLDSPAGSEKSFAIFGIIAAAAMTLLFVFVTVARRRCEKIGWQGAFDDLAQKMGLSDQERKLMVAMAQAARIKIAYVLLSDSKLFDKSALKMIEIAAGEQKDEDEIKSLKLELTFLREKLGFRKQLTLSAMSRRPIVKQADETKPVNRRRFARAAVRRQIFAAPYSSSEDVDGEGQRLLPEFVPVVLTEIGGPGLRFESDMQVKKGDKMLVVLGLDRNGGRICEHLGTEFAHNRKRLIRDIAVVRNIGEKAGMQSIAVELVGLNDNEIDGLVKATNAELIGNVKGEKISADYQTGKIVSSFIRS